MRSWMNLLIESNFATLYLSNPLYIIHFGCKKNILQHFLVWVPDRQKLQFLTYSHQTPVALIKNSCPILIFYFQHQVKGFLKRIPSYFMNAWFDMNRRPKMMISVKIGQLQMPVESQQPIMHSCFFRLKHTYIIAEQKKLHMEDFCRGLSPQKILK